MCVCVCVGGGGGGGPQGRFVRWVGWGVGGRWYSTKFCSGSLHPLLFYSRTLAPSSLLWVIKIGLDIHVMIIIDRSQYRVSTE